MNIGDAWKWRTRCLAAEDKLARASRGLEHIANPNWAMNATGRDAREMAGYAGQILEEIRSESSGEAVE